MTSLRAENNDTAEGTTATGIYYRVHGDPSSPTRVVFLQGVAASSENCCWILRALALHTSDDACVVCIDNVGIGRSPAPLERREYSIGPRAV